jgi:hypothetical protein
VLAHIKGSLEDHVATCFLTTSLAGCYAAAPMPVILAQLIPSTDKKKPQYVLMPGRPKKRRIASAGSVGTQGKYTGRCSKCKQTGHYRKTCRAVVACQVMEEAGPVELADVTIEI